MTNQPKPQEFAIVGLAALLIPCPVNAQVYQVEDGGAIQVRSGGGTVQWQSGDTQQKKLDGLFPKKATPANDQRSLMLDEAASKAGIHPALLDAVVWMESRWHSNAISPRGAVGLTQLMPGTARDLGVNPHDPIANLFAGARYLRSLLDHFNGDLIKALAAYNAGVKRVDDAGGVPNIHETQRYVSGVLDYLNKKKFDNNR